MSDYQPQTKHADLGAVYIKKQQDGSVRKFATLRIGSESFIVQLEDYNKKFERLVSSGHMEQSEADEKIKDGANKGAKYRMMLRVDQ